MFLSDLEDEGNKQVVFAAVAHSPNELLPMLLLFKGQRDGEVFGLNTLGIQESANFDGATPW
jgi:hypothetical protein